MVKLKKTDSIKCQSFGATGALHRTSLIAQLVKNPTAMWETWIRSLDWQDPLEKGKAIHSSILVLRLCGQTYSRCFCEGVYFFK